jgi:hypothetical protein
MYICVIKQSIKKQKMENLNDILDSKEFNEIFNLEQEVQELQNEGWTLQEVRSFANSLINNK